MYDLWMIQATNKANILKPIAIIATATGERPTWAYHSIDPTQAAQRGFAASFLERIGEVVFDPGKSTMGRHLRNLHYPGVQVCPIGFSPESDAQRAVDLCAAAGY